MKKLQKIILSGLILSSSSFVKINAQFQTDPTLLAALGIQMGMMDDIYKQRDKTHQALIASHGTVAGAMTLVHNLEKEVLSYMSNASSALENISQIKKSAQLLEEIGEQIVKLGKAVPKNYEGTAVTALTSKTCTDVAAEMVNLYGFMSQLVTNSHYSFSDKSNEGNGKQNINLLSAAERYYIASEVTNRLQKLYRKLWLITWQVENLGWEDAWHTFDPQSFAQYNYGKTVSQRLIKQWNNAKLK